MVHIVRAFYDLSVRRKLWSPFRTVVQPSAKEKKTRWFTLDIGNGRRPVFATVEEGTTLRVPVGVLRGGDAYCVPNRGYDQARFVLRTHSKGRGEAFWKRFEHDAERAGLPEVARAARQAAETLLQAKIESDDKFLHFGSFVVGAYDWVLLTWKGEPICEMASFRKFWNKQFRWRSASAHTHTDVVTGAPCTPVVLCNACEAEAGVSECSKCRGKGETALLHRKVNVYGAGLVQFVSFDKPAFTYERREGGLNFPVSYETSEQYAAGLSYLLANNGVSFGANLSLLAWSPDASDDHPIISLMLKLFKPWGFETREEEEQAWEQVSLTSVSEADRVALLLLRGGRGRVSVLNFDYVSAASIKRALLRFRDEFAEALGSPTVMRAAVFSHSPATIDTRKGKMGALTALFPQVMWAIATGGAYPLAVLGQAAAVPSAKDERADALAVAWRRACQARVAQQNHQ